VTRYAYRIETRKVAEPDFPYSRGNLSSAQKVAEFCGILQDSDIEKVIILHLDVQNQLNCIQVQPGTVNMSTVYIREILKHALLSGSTGMIIVHNHPSENREFSNQDKRLTRALKSACDLMQISLLDHILLTGSGYVSMVETYGPF
jgi:DNA repair protein RadC